MTTRHVLQETASEGPTCTKIFHQSESIPIRTSLHVSGTASSPSTSLSTKIQVSGVCDVWRASNGKRYFNGSDAKLAYVSVITRRSLVAQLFGAYLRQRGWREIEERRRSFHLMLESGGEMRQQNFVIETKNGRRKPLRVRRLKYTCQTKVELEITGGDKEHGSSELKREEKDVGVPVKVLSVSVSSTENDIVLSSSSGSGSDERRKTSGGGESLETLGRGTYGVVSMQGKRKEMEDAVNAEVGFAVNGSLGKFDFFGVYDGHGGADVARACRDRMHEVVAEAVELERINTSNNNNKDPVDWDWERVMEGCFGKMDEEVIAVARTVGATAVVAVVTEDQVVVGNCGDCRAVLSRGGVALALSSDHKPDRVDELKRIEAAGGRVINWNGNRVLGVLATSRSIGDQYMRPYVISKPEVTVTKRTEEDEFLILGSDGLWDVISNEVACKVVNKCLDGRTRRISIHEEDHPHDHVQSHSTSEAAAVLADLAMARGSKDNISVIVVALSKRS